MKKDLLYTLLTPLLLVACAPQYKTAQQEKTIHTIVERNVLENKDGPVNKPKHKDHIVVETSIPNRDYFPDRVIWVKGVDLSNSSIQRFSDQKQTSSHFNKNEKLLKAASYKFNITEEKLSPEAEILLQTFSAHEGERYYVEFHSAGELSSGGAEKVNAVWKRLSLKLVERGIDPKTLLNGGHFFKKHADAIIIVKLGE